MYPEKTSQSRVRVNINHKSYNLSCSLFQRFKDTFIRSEIQIIITEKTMNWMNSQSKRSLTSVAIFN